MPSITLDDLLAEDEAPKPEKVEKPSPKRKTKRTPAEAKKRRTKKASSTKTKTRKPRPSEVAMTAVKAETSKPKRRTKKSATKKTAKPAAKKAEPKKKTPAKRSGTKGSGSRPGWANKTPEEIKAIEKKRARTMKKRGVSRGRVKGVPYDLKGKVGVRDLAEQLDLPGYKVRAALREAGYTPNDSGVHAFTKTEAKKVVAAIRRALKQREANKRTRTKAATKARTGSTKKKAPAKKTKTTTTKKRTTKSAPKKATRKRRTTKAS
jgi:hypothetical protein